MAISGGALVIRRIRRSDAAELERFYADLSDESRQCRFLGATRGLSHVQSVGFCTPDHAHQEGFVALRAQGFDGRARIVGHLCIEPTSATNAEVAVAVADSDRAQGIGRRLVEAGAAWAGAAGIERLSATMFAWNTPIHRLLTSLGLPSTVRSGGDLLVVTIELGAPVPAAA